MDELKQIVEAAWEDRSLLAAPETRRAIDCVVDLLDKGFLRVAQPDDSGSNWTVNQWIKKAIILRPVRL